MVNLAQRSGDWASAIDSMLWLVRIYMQVGEWGRALGLCEKALDRCASFSSSGQLASARLTMAWVLVQMGAHEQALDHLNEAMQVFAEAQGRLGLAQGYALAGEAMLALQRLEQAGEHFEQAWALGRDTHTVEVAVLAQLGLAKLAVAQQDWPEGQRTLTEARARARRAGLDALVVAARLGLVQVYIGRAEWRNAQREALQALDASRRLRCPYDIFCAAAGMGESLIGLGEPERAKRYYREAWTMIQRLAQTLPDPYAAMLYEQQAVQRVGLYAEDNSVVHPNRQSQINDLGEKRVAGRSVPR
jgi:tetratricopeptide (TPR) repeat protein